MSIKSKILKTTAITAVILSGGLTAGLLYMHTQSGLDVLSRTVNRVTADTSMPITLGRMHGSLFHDLALESVTVADHYGVWLQAEHIRIAWSPLALLTGAPVLRVMSASLVDVQRLPEIADTELPEDEKLDQDNFSFSLESISRFLPRTLDIQHITIGSALTRGQEQDLRLHGVGRGKAYALELETIKGPQTELRLNGILSDRRPQLHINVDEQAGGVLGGLLQLPHDTIITGQVKLDTEGRNLIRLTETNISIGNMSLIAEGIYQKRQKDLGLQVTLDVPDLSLLNHLTDKSLQGAIKIDATAEGVLDSVVFDAHATMSGVMVENQSVPQVTVAVQSILNILAKTFDAQMTHTPIDITEYGFAGQVTTNVNAKGSLDYLESTAKVILDTAQGQSVLDAQADLNFVEKNYKGTLSGLLVHAKDQFDLGVDFTLQDHKHLELPVLSLQGPGVDMKGALTADLEAYRAVGALHINVDDLQPLGRYVQQDIKGRIKADMVLDRVDHKQNATVHIDALSVDAMGQSIRLRDKASLVWQDQHIVLSPTYLTLNGDVIEAQATLTDDQVQARIRATGFSFDRFVPALTEGKANIALDITGRADQPIIQLKTKGHLRAQDMPLKFDVVADWANQNLNIKADGQSGAATIKAQAQLASSLSLLPFATDISDKTGLKGNLTADLPLESLNPFLWPMGHRITGHMNGRFGIDGRVGQPQINGKAVLQNMTYDHVSTGICLRHVQSVIQVTQDHLTVQSLTAKDDDGKMMSARFKAGLTGAQTLDGGLSLDRFRLFCGGLATGQIDGGLRITGILKNMQVGGKLTLGPLNVQLPGAQHESKIPSLKTVRMKQGQLTENPPTKIGLDIILDAPQQIFIRGRGLDAEFGGALTITGEASSPIVAGKFASRRGTFNFLDRVMSLTQGDLNFAGPIPPSPILNIETETKVRGTALRVGLQGSVTGPKLTLSSQPSLPQDEILALLLFGRQLQAISPFEALKLAQATRTLAGLDGGEPGILDRARNMLGLDVLNVSTSDNNEVTISTGKYVTDKVFVGVQQGNKPEDKLIKTEIELTPAISANTTMDGNANQGFGINWRYDY
jgi:autotransporter translocation and assembly factor TamB